MSAAAIDELVGWALIDERIREELLGPLFRCGAIRTEEMEAFLLDGTYLGKVGELPREP